MLNDDPEQGCGKYQSPGREDGTPYFGDSVKVNEKVEAPVEK